MLLVVLQIVKAKDLWAPLRSFLRFEVLMAVKNVTVFWDVMPYNKVDGLYPDNGRRLLFRNPVTCILNYSLSHPMRPYSLETILLEVLFTVLRVYAHFRLWTGGLLDSMAKSGCCREEKNRCRAANRTPIHWSSALRHNYFCTMGTRERHQDWVT
jgi:hypothetical protein